MALSGYHEQWKDLLKLESPVCSTSLRLCRHNSQDAKKLLTHLAIDATWGDVCPPGNASST